MRLALLCLLLAGCTSTGTWDPPPPRTPIIVRDAGLRIVWREDLDRYHCEHGVPVIRPVSGSSRTAREFELRCSP